MIAPRNPAILIWPLVCLCASAQQSGDSASIKVDVRQVVVPMVVTDKKGHHVTGLRASAFQVLEDGVPQEIVAFSSATAGSVEELTALSQPASASATPATNAQGRPRHSYVICIDALHSSFASSAHARESLDKLFEKEKGSDAQYILVSLGRQLRVIQPATNDPAAIRSKIRSSAFPSSSGGQDAAMLAAAINDVKRRMEELCRICACGPRSVQRECSAEKEAIRQGLDAEAERYTVLGDSFLVQLKSVVEELAKLPGGRTLILISDGFNLKPAREFYAVAAAYLPNNSQFKMDGPHDLEPRLQEILKIAASRNVIVSSIDSRGVSSPSFSSNGSMDASTAAPGSRTPQSVILRPTTPGDRGAAAILRMDHEAGSVAFESGSAMQQLATATGGTFFHDNNDMLKQLSSVLADGREYYVAAYVPKNAAQDGKFRRITIETSDKKLTVRAKSGYWAAQ